MNRGKGLEKEKRFFSGVTTFFRVRRNNTVPFKLQRAFHFEAASICFYTDINYYIPYLENLGLAENILQSSALSTSPAPTT